MLDLGISKYTKDFWNDIDFPIYLSTNHKKIDSQIFNSLVIGDELSWSDNLIKSLKKLIRSMYY